MRAHGVCVKASEVRRRRDEVDVRSILGSDKCMITQYLVIQLARNNTN
jgi:hypothetical protein